MSVFQWAIKVGFHSSGFNLLLLREHARPGVNGARFPAATGLHAAKFGFPRVVPCGLSAGNTWRKHCRSLSTPLDTPRSPSIELQRPWPRVPTFPTASSGNAWATSVGLNKKRLTNSKSLTCVVWPVFRSHFGSSEICLGSGPYLLSVGGKPRAKYIAPMFVKDYKSPEFRHPSFWPGSFGQHQAQNLLLPLPPIDRRIGTSSGSGGDREGVFSVRHSCLHYRKCSKKKVLCGRVRAVTGACKFRLQLFLCICLAG